LDEVERDWQKPLSEEKIARLVEEFAKAKAQLEEIWGYRGPPPWVVNRRGDA